MVRLYGNQYKKYTYYGIFYFERVAAMISGSFGDWNHLR